MQQCHSHCQPIDRDSDYYLSDVEQWLVVMVLVCTYFKLLISRALFMTISNAEIRAHLVRLQKRHVCKLLSLYISLYLTHANKTKIYV